MVGAGESSPMRVMRVVGWLRWISVFVILSAYAARPLPGAAEPVATPAASDAGHGGHGGDIPMREPSGAERRAAETLERETKVAAARFTDFQAAEAEGYVQLTPFSFYGVRAAHFGNPDYMADGRELDPERPENLVYLKRDDGRLELLGVMFLAPIGQGPPVGDPLTEWHAHEDLCASAQPPAVVPILPTGACPAGTTPVGYEMLHLWVVDHPDGPFSHLPPGGSAGGPLTSEETGGSLAAANALVDWPALIGEVGRTLRLNPMEIAQRFSAGESLAEMADAQGIDRAVLTRAVQGRMVADMNRALAAGDMTAGQHALIMRSMSANVERMVSIHRGEPWVAVSESA